LGELVVSRGDTPEILEPAEAPLDGVAVFASLLVVADFLFAIGAAQYPPVIFPRGSGLVHRCASLNQNKFASLDLASNRLTKPLNQNRVNLVLTLALDEENNRKSSRSKQLRHDHKMLRSFG
jgi:hypothetical protein